jgi:hypothetical protein
MYAQFHDVRLFVIAINVVLDVYAVGLWFFAFQRTHRQFCLMLTIAAVGALFLAVVGGAFAYDLAAIKRFDPSNRLYGISYFVVQPLIAVLTIIGQTLLVRSLARADGNTSSGV